MKPTIPRGIRNNNPLNIRRSGDKWQGLRDEQTDPAFCQFKDTKWGIRAGARVLQNYQRLHHLQTLRQIITRFAPPEENHTSRYLEVVARRAKIQPDIPLDLSNRQLLHRLIEAMCFVECGVPIDQHTITEGLDLLYL